MGAQRRGWTWSMEADSVNSQKYETRAVTRWTDSRAITWIDMSLIAERKSIVLDVVTAPRGGVTVLRKQSTDPFFMGGGADDLLCGQCNWLLLHAVDRRRLRNAVIQCPFCSAYNEMGGTFDGPSRFVNA